MGLFWIKFIVGEAISVVSVLLGATHIKPELQAALQKFVDDGRALLLIL